jgi:hypothetical protein
MYRQAPQLNFDTRRHGRPGIQPTGASAHASGGDDTGNMTDAQLHDQLTAKLKFRLAAIEVRAPAFLPGGSRTIGLASIAEASGAPGAGLAGAILRFAGSIWPNLRQLQLWVCVEPPAKPTIATAPRATSDIKVTVYLENPRNGATVATKTLVGDDINEAASMVAGYVARQVFTQDPSIPPWCYGSADGDDLAALLLYHLESVRPETPAAVETSRDAQIDTLWEPASTLRSAGIVRYELAQLLDLDGYHLAALRLHAMNLDQHPRFYRGRYRLGTSLEMIANSELKLRYDDDSKRRLDEVLSILNRNRPSVRAKHEQKLTQCADDKTLCSLSPSLRLYLLTFAARELRETRAQLTLRRVLWDTFRRRNERAIWLPYWIWLPEWGLRRRWAFRDGARVAELLIAIRIKLIGLELHDWKPDSAKPEDQELCQALNAGATLVEKNLRHGHYQGAIKIASAIAGEASAVAGESERIRREQSQRIRQVLDQPTTWKADDLSLGTSGTVPLRHRLRGVWHQRRAKASWQAAYNAACLYAALGRKELDQALVVTCLRSAVSNPRSEMERAYDWISRDPDLSFLEGRDTPFQEFLDAQKRLDYPAAFPAERPSRRETGRNRGRSGSVD